jgi:serine/threonine protein kinase
VHCHALDPAAADALHAAASAVPHGMISHDFVSQLSELSQHLSLAYERVTLPCSSMNCGDAIYRSTLDPALRMERKLFPDWRGLLLLGTGLLYLLSTPGVLAGAIDSYISAPLQRAKTKAFGKEDIRLGKKLASGGFGTVFRGELLDVFPEKELPVVVKKAKEFGVPEVWMNERIMRIAPKSFAEFLYAFEEECAKGPDLLWLVWRYEGDFTLFDLLQKRDWPYNAEAIMRGRSQPSSNRSPRRKLNIIRGMMKEILEGLKACHNTGIVHRDVKPQNVMVSEVSKCCKFIDLGAAADLRIGTNYIPNEFLLDPRYAPPQQYIMSTQTPRAPPRPVAALLSPILWRLNSPDRFDMYSTGITFLQMVFGPLQSDNGLAAFNKRLAAADYDLQAWRRAQEKKGGKDWAEGFAVMDLDNGTPWDFACQLVQYEPEKRMTAAQALAHPLVTASPIGKTLLRAKSLGTAASQAATSFTEPWLGAAAQGTQRSGGLTEAQINEMSEEMGVVPEALKNASSTVSWWQGRQAHFNSQLSQRRKKLASNVGEALNITRKKQRARQ